MKEIGMYHMMKESAVEKAKSRAVEKLRESYPGSRLQVWRTVHTLCIVKVFEDVWTFFCPSKPCVSLSTEGKCAV